MNTKYYDMKINRQLLHTIYNVTLANPFLAALSRPIQSPYQILWHEGQ